MSEDEQLKAALNNLSSLTRVDHKLALTDAANLQQVLRLLLPRLLSRIGNNHVHLGQDTITQKLRPVIQKTHELLVSMLSHIMKRVREDATCKLPCKAIIDLLLAKKDSSTVFNSSVDPFTLNLALAFLTLGSPRSGMEEAALLLPDLLVLLVAHSGPSSLRSPSRKVQANQVAHLLLRLLERIVVEDTWIPFQSNHTSIVSTLSGSKAAPASTSSASKEVMDQVRDLLANNESAAGSLYELLLDTLLYQSSSSTTMPPPGLSQAGNERLRAGSSVTEGGWASEMAKAGRLRDLKLAILDLVAPTRRWALFMGGTNSVGISRTVALLVASSGDGHADVSDRADSYLKLHKDTFRSKSDDDGKSLMTGNPVTVMIGLQKLVLGDSNAEVALSNLGEMNTIPTLDRAHDVTSSPEERNLIMSLKRRMTSEKATAGILLFCSKLLEETPHLLIDLPDALAVGALTNLATTRLLAGYTSGLSVLRASSCIAASKLLNALCTRLTSSPTVLDDCRILDFLSTALSSCCYVLSNAASSHSLLATPIVGEGSVIVRDACYGVVCSLARCPEFCDGRLIIASISPTHESMPSVEIATMLFGCAANEEDTLRPRAVAALDALLGAYCRTYGRDVNDDCETCKLAVNPWIIRPGSSRSTHGEAMARRENLSKALLPLLWNAAHPSTTKASRIAAATWCSKLLKVLDAPNGCNLLCCLAGDSDLTAASIARGGLGLDEKLGEPYEASSTLILHDFADIARALFVAHDESTSCRRPRYFGFSDHGKAAALRFGLNCLLSDLYNTDESAVRLYLCALCDTFRHFGTSSVQNMTILGRESVDLLDECSICLSGCVSSSRFARSLIVNEETSYNTDDLRFLTVNGASSKARRYLAESLGRLYEDYDLWLTGESQTSFEQWLTSCRLLSCLRTCLEKVSEISNGTFLTGEAHGAAFLGAWSVRTFRLRAAQESSIKAGGDIEGCWDVVSEILASLGRGISHTDEVVGQALTNSIGIAVSYETLDAPILDSRIYAGVSTALHNLEGTLRRHINGDHTDPIRSSCLIKAIGTVLAASTSAAGHVSETCSIGKERLKSVDALFVAIGSAAFRHDAEIALLAGEALAAYADAYSPENSKWSAQLGPRPSEFCEKFFLTIPPHEQILYGLLDRDIKSSNHHKRTAVAPALTAIVARAARIVNVDDMFVDRAMTTEIIKRLPEIQRALVSLLSDPRCKQLSRESCCLGLAACQGIAAVVSGRNVETNGCRSTLMDSMNETLLKAFGQTSSFGGSAMMESQTQNAERIRRENIDHEGSADSSYTAEQFGVETTEVGGAAGIGEAALGAYREMAGAAVVLGRSDVLYALLLLSVSHPAWFTTDAKDRYGATALLGNSSLLGDRTNTVEIRNALRPHIGKLVPRLLRAKHDPNKQTREQMEILWLGLTGGGAEARQVITDHLISTIDSLIEDAQSKLWRARVGACGALAEVIVARTWSELGGGDACLEDDEIIIRTITSNTSAAVRLLRLWRVAMRALDDVREAVRESGEVLARSVKGLTIRLCDPNLTLRSSKSAVFTNSDYMLADELARAASSTSLRYLLRHGLDQKCREAAAVCVSCLTGIVEIVRPSTLEPVLPELLGSLLMAMSGLEPAALNYFQVRAAGSDSSESYDRLEQARIQFAQSGPIALALNRCLEIVPLVDLQIQQSIIPQLDTALRSGAGFATRAATADSVSSLCHTCPTAFKFPGVSSTNPTVRLLRALYFASERERGVAAKDKMSHALGNLASLSPGQTVRSLVVRACNRYTFATGNNDDTSVRRAAAAAVRSIVVRAPNQVADGGPNAVWSRKVLPVAFLGRKDNDRKIASLWKEVWDDGGASLSVQSGAAFGPLIEERVLLGLVRECVDALNDVAWARRVSGATSLSELCDNKVLTPIRRSGSESSLNLSPVDQRRDERRAKAAKSALKSCVELLMKPRMWSGKTEVIKATVKIATGWAHMNNFVGVTDSSEMDPYYWVPIMMAPRGKSIDLFEGDKYFELPTLEAFVDDESALETKEDPEDGSASDAPIDFSEGDLMLTQTNPDSKTSGEYVSPAVSFLGLCRALFNHALPPNGKTLTLSQDEMLPFKAAALEGVADLLNTAKLSQNSAGILEEMYILLVPRLLSIIDSQGVLISQSEYFHGQPPLIVARATQCFHALIWEGIGKSGEALQDVTAVSAIFQNVGGAKQGAWTVREAALLATSELANLSPVRSLRCHNLLSQMLAFSNSAQQDKKFWRVRVAGLTVMKSLVSRAGVGNSGRRDPSTGATVREVSQQLMLEALLPFKEDVLKSARAALNDPQSDVTALASTVCGLIAWWI